MNEFTLAARRPREVSDADLLPQEPAVRPEPVFRTLSDLSREELLREALYDPTASIGQGGDLIDDDRLREEVRWRRSVALREPALAALARLLSKVSSDSLESLSQGDISAEQLVEKADGFASGQGGVKILKLSDRVEDHERRLKNLESDVD